MITTLPILSHLAAPPLAASGTQFMPVRGYITDRMLVTYRAPAAQLTPLVPAPFALDTHAGYGFLSVCAVEILGMQIGWTPVRFDNREFLYRVSVRLGERSTFLTLRSDVSSRALAWLGRHFSHYRPQRARVALARTGSSLTMDCVSRDGAGTLAVDLGASGPACSVFADADSATQFLLGMDFSADAVAGRVRVQPIAHSPWQPRWVHATRDRFSFLDQLAHQLGARFEYDGTLAVHGVQQVWGAARWMRQ